MADMNQRQQRIPKSRLTPKDVIGWCQDQQSSLGQIGFSTVWRPDTINGLVSFETTFSTSPADLTPVSSSLDVHTAMEDQLAGWQQREDATRMIRTKTRDILNETKQILPGKLLAAGMSQEEIEELVAKNTGVRDMVVALYNQQHPKSKSIPTVMLRVAVADRGAGKDRMQDVHLPIRGSLSDIEAILHDISTTVLDGNAGNLGHGVWQYQLVDTKKRPQATRVPLLTDSDYNDMMREITKKNSGTPSAILTQVRRHAA